MYNIQLDSMYVLRRPIAWLWRYRYRMLGRCRPPPAKLDARGRPGRVCKGMAGRRLGKGRQENLLCGSTRPPRIRRWRQPSSPLRRHSPLCLRAPRLSYSTALSCTAQRSPSSRMSLNRRTSRMRECPREWPLEHRIKVYVEKTHGQQS